MITMPITTTMILPITIAIIERMVANANGKNEFMKLTSVADVSVTAEPAAAAAAAASAAASAKAKCELTKIKIEGKTTGLLMIGGGTPKNFTQDTVVCAEILGFEASLHKYAIQITVADSRDGACSSSTLKEANSWGKVETTKGSDQMVFAEATSVLPLIASYAYHKGSWKNREFKNWSKLFQK